MGITLFHYKGSAFMRIMLVGNILDDFYETEDQDFIKFVENYVSSDEVWCEYRSASGKLYKTELKDVHFVDVANLEDFFLVFQEISPNYDVNIINPRYKIPSFSDTDVVGWLVIGND